jgi:hypothetical protein
MKICLRKGDLTIPGQVDTHYFVLWRRPAWHITSGLRFKINKECQGLQFPPDMNVFN